MIYQMGIIIMIIPVMTFLVYPHDDGFSLIGIMNDKFMGGIKKRNIPNQGWKLWHVNKPLNPRMTEVMARMFSPSALKQLFEGVQQVLKQLYNEVRGSTSRKSVSLSKICIDTWTWVSCRFSLKPIHSRSSLWMLKLFPLSSGSLTYGKSPCLINRQITM